MKIEELKAIVSAFIATSNENEDKFYDMLLGNSSLTIEDIRDFTFESVVSNRINSDYQSVFRVEGKLYELWGWYGSWDGTKFDDLTGFYEVTPVNKTITVYKPL